MAELLGHSGRCGRAGAESRREGSQGKAVAQWRMAYEQREILATGSDDAFIEWCWEDACSSYCAYCLVIRDLDLARKSTYRGAYISPLL